MTIHIFCKHRCRSPVFMSLALLQLLLYSYTPAVLPQVETKQPHFIHTIGQNLLLGRFPLRKNTFRHSTLPEMGELVMKH